MSKLPVVAAPSNPRVATALRVRRVWVHSLRVALLIGILTVIRWSNASFEMVDSRLDANPTALQFAQSVFPNTNSIGPMNPALDGHPVLDLSGETLGLLLQTSPRSDHLIGYSGPTNCLIAVNLDREIAAVRILASGDTVDHVAQVRTDPTFLGSFAGLGLGTSNDWTDLDTVSGATLTSHAITASIAERISGEAPSLKFDPQPRIETVSRLFGEPVVISPASLRSVWDVYSMEQEQLGVVLSTSPVADHLSGYQGPTAALAGFGLDDRCLGVMVDQTYDNTPYANYLDDDDGFARIYRGKTIQEISTLNPSDAGIEGVSGATMTSVCVAEGLAVAARDAMNKSGASNSTGSFARHWTSYLMDALTILLAIVGLLFSFTSINRWRHLRVGYQLATIVVLGLISGHMISQALLAGWAMHSIAWQVAPGLAFLTVAALAVPIVSKQQTYCQHICPMGAIQQLSRNRVGVRLRIPRMVNRFRGLVPLVLLGVTVTVATGSFEFNLASIEPFDGFGFRVAGWASISILIVGLAVSLVSPMAYCRFGCPAGAVLNYIRFRADSHRLGIRDVCAVSMLIVGLAITNFR